MDPDRGPLSPAEVATIEKWILSGAPDPRTDLRQSTAIAPKPQVGMSIEGDKVAVAARLDRKGLLVLGKKIDGLLALLEPEDGDTENDDDL